MAINFITSATAQDGTFTATSLALPLALNPGDFVVLYVTRSGTILAPSVSDDGANIWTQRTGYASGSPYIWVFTASIVNPGTTITATFAAGDRTVMIAGKYSGVSGVGVNQGSTTASNTTTTVTATVSATTSWLVALVTLSGGSTPTASAGNLRSTVNQAGLGFCTFSDDTGSLTPAVTLNWTTACYCNRAWVELIAATGPSPYLTAAVSDGLGTTFSDALTSLMFPIPETAVASDNLGFTDAVAAIVSVPGAAIIISVSDALPLATSGAWNLYALGGVWFAAPALVDSVSYVTQIFQGNWRVNGDVLPLQDVSLAATTSNVTVVDAFSLAEFGTFQVGTRASAADLLIINDLTVLAGFGYEQQGVSDLVVLTDSVDTFMMDAVGFANSLALFLNDFLSYSLQVITVGNTLAWTETLNIFDSIAKFGNSFTGISDAVFLLDSPTVTVAIGTAAVDGLTYADQITVALAEMVSLSDALLIQDSAVMTSFAPTGIYEFDQLNVLDFVNYQTYNLYNIPVKVGCVRVVPPYESCVGPEIPVDGATLILFRDNDQAIEVTAVTTMDEIPVTDAIVTGTLFKNGVAVPTFKNIPFMAEPNTPGNYLGVLPENFTAPSGNGYRLRISGATPGSIFTVYAAVQVEMREVCVCVTT